MPVIDVTNLSFSFSSQPLLDGVSLNVGDGERAVLIGPNGAGKTTFIRIIRGEIAPERGAVAVSGVPNASCFLFPSVLKACGTAQDYLDEVLSDLRALMNRFNEVTIQLAENSFSAALVDEYDWLLARLNASEAWSIDAKIDEALAGLGLTALTGDERNRAVGTLSPGQASRLELAAIMLARPPILILDEPTNHLDDDAVAYLVDQIVNWDGPVLMASHDRAFIEETATAIYDLDTGPWQALVTAEGGGQLPGLYRCAGAYSDYLVAKQRARTEHQKIHAAQQNAKRNINLHRRHSKDIARGGAKLVTAEGMARKFFSDRAAATAVRRTRNDDQRLERLAEREVRKPRTYHLKLDLPEIRPSGGLAVTVRNAAAKGRLHDTTFDLAVGEHLLLTGPNGAGKTTLLRWIATGRPPAISQERVSDTVTVNGVLAYVPQHLPQLGDAGITADRWERGIGELGEGILHPSMWSTPIHQLSDGNQRRAQIALAIARAPEILLIDEPTNYIDLATIEELETALHNWNGTLIIASHDRWLIEHWQGPRLDLPPGTQIRTATFE